MPGVFVGFNPGVPELPPEKGVLSGDPVRFGVSDMLSFSPLGTATPGTFTSPATTPGRGARQRRHARVRLMLWRGGKWVER